MPPAPPPVRLPATPIVVHTYTREELASGQLPPSEWGLLLAHSYSPNGGWYVMVIPAAYQMQTLKGGTTHFSPWSYDRHVPLAFYGAPFTPGIYHGRVQPVDLAATLASLLGVTQPSASVGTVLVQAIHTLPAAPVPRGAKGARRSPQEGAASQ
jgi:arylsulfatase A-like enzyme